MRHNLDFVQHGLIGERFTIDLTDNTAATICAVPSGKKCRGVVIPECVGGEVEAINWSAATGSVVVTPQFVSNGAGTCEVVVMFTK